MMSHILCRVQVTIYHLLKLFQSETDIMLGKKSLVAEFYDELVRPCFCFCVCAMCLLHVGDMDWSVGRAPDSCFKGCGFVSQQEWQKQFRLQSYHSVLT